MSRRARNFKRSMRRYSNYERYAESLDRKLARYDKSARSDAHMPDYERTPAPFHNGRKR